MKVKSYGLNQLTLREHFKCRINEVTLRKHFKGMIISNEG